VKLPLRAAVTVGSGGAIVHLSDPQEEHAEILLKLKVALGSVSLVSIPSVRSGRQAWSRPSSPVSACVFFCAVQALLRATTVAIAGKSAPKWSS
jgi:hypothetical protein